MCSCWMRQWPSPSERSRKVLIAADQNPSPPCWPVAPSSTTRTSAVVPSAEMLPRDIDRGIGREQVGDIVVHPAVEVIAVSRDAVLRGAELEQQGGVLREILR